MKITIIAVGKLKEKYFKDAVNEYSKRLGRYCKFDIVEVADEKTPDAASENEKNLIRKKEADRILKHISDDAHVITLEIDGKMPDSVQFSEYVENLGIKGKSHIVFIIGGSLGLHTDVSSRADYKLSFGRMTFPHQLMRIVLLEQIYRAYRIINNEPYHK